MKLLKSSRVASIQNFELFSTRFVAVHNLWTACERQAKNSGGFDPSPSAIESAAAAFAAKKAAGRLLNAREITETHRVA